MRRATQDDLPAIRAFLEARVERAMFPLSNLARHGLDGDHDLAPSMWLAEADGALAGVLTVGRNGMVLPALAGTDPAAAADELRDRALAGIIGPTDEARPLEAALGLSGHPATLNRDEPHFALDLADLVLPAGAGTLRPLGAADPQEMIRWRAAYSQEALGLPPDRAATDAHAAYSAFVRAGSHRVLMEGDRPLSTTGFNARLPGIVQVGGVYTPPALRGHGYARRAVALHLDEARASGVGRATLFSASAMAARCYRAIGFRQIGWWTLLVLDTGRKAG